MLKQRVVTAFFLFMGMGWALFYTSEKQWLVLVALIAIVALWEWAQLGRYSLLNTGLYVLGSMGVFLLILFLDTTNSIILTINILSVAFWLIIAPLWLKRGWHLQNKWTHALLGWLLIFATFSSLSVIKQSGALHLLLLFGVIWLSDSAAYFAGRSFGRHKLAPSISPGKTWEGVAGALFAVGLYGLFLQLFWPWQKIPLTIWIQAHPILFYSLLLTIVAFGIEGDLFESWLKRCVGVKDSGFILPGHGGILDRIDALIATLPIMAIWTQSLIK